MKEKQPSLATYVAPAPITYIRSLFKLGFISKSDQGELIHRILCEWIDGADSGIPDPESGSSLVQGAADLDQLFDLGLIGKSDWIKGRWLLCMGTRNVLTGDEVATGLPRLHHMIQCWHSAGWVQYTITRDMELSFNYIDGTNGHSISLVEVFLEANSSDTQEYLLWLEEPIIPAACQE